MKLRITLSSPIEINGIRTDTLYMREPTVGDQLDSEKLAKDAGERELRMFSLLCECAPDDLRRLTIRDLERMQKAYLRLLADDDPAGNAVVEVVP
ncbi:hypothetical protein GCM10027202_12720 [Microvirgula curvata]|uniref:Phage tail assembly protein n=1 Tax=Microvirgula aerodenitrificans TaxID=57480 RepID=A0A2S0PEE6_9NEIS|nr:phage tail assembly protein [Microvirgula aerodenitrificans]AVY95693.1 phage tail assembly protein [Microvirgula aerodenitrificans]